MLLPNSIRSRPVHSENAYLPIDTTLSGMMTDLREWQSRNAASSICMTPLPMVTDVSEPQC